MPKGSATADHHSAYFTACSSTSVCKYELNTNKWEVLNNQCPHRDSGLVIINDELTAVGGYDGSCPTNELWTLQEGQWLKRYPQMNTARFHTAVVSTSDGNYILAIGGQGDDSWTTTVEIFHVKSEKWYELRSPLPQALPLPSAVIHGDQLYVIGNKGNGYTCSLRALLTMASNEPQPMTSQPLWKPLPCLPVMGSTAAILHECLVAIGGERIISGKGMIHEKKVVNSIHQLIDEEWVKIGCMSITKSECLVVNQSSEKLLIVGGLEENGFEECVVVEKHWKVSAWVLLVCLHCICVCLCVWGGVGGWVGVGVGVTVCVS